MLSTVTFGDTVVSDWTDLGSRAYTWRYVSVMQAEYPLLARHAEVVDDLTNFSARSQYFNKSFSQWQSQEYVVDKLAASLAGLNSSTIGAMIRYRP